VNVVVLLAAMAVTAVAAAGVTRPFRRSDVPALEQLPDPLEEERVTLLRALRQLEEDHVTGGLDDKEYRALRSETEGRAVTVIHALAAREGVREIGPALREIRTPPAGNGQQRRRGTRSLPVIIAVAASVTVAVPVLANAIVDRSDEERFTGSIGTTNDPIAFFENRVRTHPDDVAARLDLAQRYMETGDVQSAARQYASVLRLNPRNAEANAKAGLLLSLAGRPREGLARVERALAVDPGYPEGLFARGLILYSGLHRPAQAAGAFRAYLRMAPFGSHVTEARRALRAMA
jgi:tetratricopeptide (TPR) repeat protein